MAFPSTVGSTPNPLSVAWLNAMKIAANVKTDAQSLKTLSLAGNVGSSAILQYLTRVADYKVQLNACAAVPGIGPYAQAQVNNPSLDVSAAFSAMTTQMDAVRDWVISNFPKDASNYLLAVQFDVNGRTTDRQFSTASLATFRTQLDSLIATID